MAVFQRGRRSYSPAAAALRLPRAVHNLSVGPPVLRPACRGPLRDTISALAAQAFVASSPNARPCCFDAEGLRALRRACREEQKGADGAAATPLRMLRLQALSDHARLGLRHVQVAAEEQRLLERARDIVRPGARSASAVALSLGLEAGLPGAVALGTTVSAGTGRPRSCFETLEYAEGSEQSASVSAHVRGGVPALGLGLSARAAFGISRTHYDGAVTPEEFARVRARERVAAPLRARLLQRLRSVVNAERRAPVDRIAEAARAVVHWEDLMPALLGKAPADAARGGGLPREALLRAPAPLLDVWIDGTTRQLSAGAGLGAFNAGVQYARTRQAVGLEVPCWLPATRLDEEERVALECSLRERLHAGLHGQTWSAAVLACDTADRDARVDAVQQLRVQFQHLQKLRTAAELGPDPGHALKTLKRFCRQWNARDLQTTLRRLLDLVHWLALSTDAADPAQCPVREAAAALASDIHSSPALRQDARALRKAHACIHMYQHFATRLVQVDLGASLAGITPGAALQLAHTRQRNYNPLRAGEYIEASISLSAAVEATALWHTLQQRIPALAGSDMPGDFGFLLREAIADEFSAGATATLALRFFKADFQHESGFAAAARGMHLQQVTCRSAASVGLAATVPLAAAGLPGATAGVSFVHQRARPLREDVFCSTTMTALVLRYHSLLGQGHAPAVAWQTMLDNHAGSVQRLAEALASPTSNARAEATFWLGKAGADPGDIPWNALVFTPANRWRVRSTASDDDSSPAGVSGRDPPPLQQLLDRIVQGVNAVQKRSSMRSPLRLHGTRLKMPRL